MTEKDLLTGFLSKTLNMDESGVTSLYKEDGSELLPDALDTILRLDVERVQKLKPDTKGVFQDGYKKAKLEVLNDFEKEFKEKTGFKSDKKGVDLMLEYASKQSQNGELTEDVIKKHPLYIDTVERLTNQMEDAIKAEQNKLTEFQTGIKKQETFSSVANKATVIFNSLKPILSQDPAKAKNQMDDFVNKLKEYEYEIQEDRVVVLTKDGKVLENSHGHRIAFDDIVRQTAERYYDFHKAEGRTSPNNQGQPQTKPASIKVPDNEEEYVKVLNDPAIKLEDKAAIKEAYHEKVKNN
jgi:hypothetical protein